MRRLADPLTGCVVCFLAGYWGAEYLNIEVFWILFVIPVLIGGWLHENYRRE